jgi:hypothetical protein
LHHWLSIEKHSGPFFYGGSPLHLARCRMLRGIPQTSFLDYVGSNQPMKATAPIRIIAMMLFPK